MIVTRPETPRSPLRLQELGRRECLDLLATVVIGRVGLSIDALPAVLPVTFALLDGTVVFRSRPGAKLSAAATGAVIAFEADQYDPKGRTGWSVMVRGVAHEIIEPDLLERARGLPLESWAHGHAADRFVRIEPTLVTGRRVGARPG